MTGFWIVMAVLLIGGLYLAWRTDHKNRARRAALQGQQPGTMQDVRGDPNVVRVRHDQPGGGIIPGG